MTNMASARVSKAMTMIDPFYASLIVIVGLTVSGLSIGIAMICGSSIYLVLRGLDASIAAETLLQGLFSNYTLLAIPLFVLAADIMNIGSLADRLLRFCQGLVGRFRGGLGYVNVVSSLIFSGMSGSAVADAVGMGRIIINMMTKDGKYSASYAAAITAATATVGPIIPPSIPMVLYSLVSDQSIGYLFAAGMAPGLLMAFVMGVLNWWIARRRNFPIDESVTLRELPMATFRATPALMLPVILLGGIYGGVVTPTEAAAVAAFYALIISVVLYRSVTLGQFWAALLNSARSTASVGILIAGALTFNYVITREDLPNAIASVVGQFDFSPASFLLFMNVLFLVLGCILEGGAILLIIAPIFIPTAQALGIDLIHFGVIIVVNSMIGLITPPYGLLLFIVANITGEPIGRVIKELMPFVVVLLAALLFITYVPDFVLFLPRLLGYKG